MSIAITGATGQLGQLVVEKLIAKIPASEVVALVRNTAKAEGLGVAAREADYSRPETLEASLAGVETLLLISSSELGQRIAQHQNVIEAAKRAGVRRVVYTSLLKADTSPMSLAVEHLATEKLLVSSGLAYTILRNGWYTENYVGSIHGAVAAGAVVGSAGEGKIAAASRSDYADAAVVVLTTEGHDGKVYELAGDTAFTLADLAAEISRQTGREIPFHNLPESEYAAALASHGLPGPIAGALASWDVDASNGWLYDDGKVLSALIGHPTTPISATVAQVLG